MPSCEKCTADQRWAQEPAANFRLRTLAARGKSPPCTSGMKTAHSVARWKSRGFPRSTGIASSDTALYPQPANLPVEKVIHDLFPLGRIRRRTTASTACSDFREKSPPRAVSSAGWTGAASIGGFGLHYGGGCLGEWPRIVTVARANSPRMQTSAWNDEEPVPLRSRHRPQTAARRPSAQERRARLPEPIQ